jgi:hypothetical protein
MVKVGFICEGESDAFLLQSDTFNLFLREINISRVNVIDATGCGNLLPHNITQYLIALEKQGAQKIVVLADLDDAPCITHRKQYLGGRPQDTLIIAAKELEAWYLADSTTMKRLLRLQHFDCAYPEADLDPFNKINELLVANIGRGIGTSDSGKLKLAKRVLDFGFDFNKCAAHPNCFSAEYFVKKLKEIGTAN